MIFLSNCKVNEIRRGYPFIPLIVNTPSFTFTNSVTILCGDNGSGKSTFAKILSAACNCVCVSYEKTQNEVFTKNADCFSVSRKFLPKRSFYCRPLQQDLTNEGELNVIFRRRSLSDSSATWKNVSRMPCRQ